MTRLRLSPALLLALTPLAEPAYAAAKGDGLIFRLRTLLEQTHLRGK